MNEVNEVIYVLMTSYGFIHLCFFVIYVIIDQFLLRYNNYEIDVCATFQFSLDIKYI